MTVFQPTDDPIVTCFQIFIACGLGFLCLLLCVAIATLADQVLRRRRVEWKMKGRK